MMVNQYRLVWASYMDRTTRFRRLGQFADVWECSLDTYLPHLAPGIRNEVMKIVVGQGDLRSVGPWRFNTPVEVSNPPLDPLTLFNGCLTTHKKLLMGAIHVISPGYVSTIPGRFCATFFVDKKVDGLPHPFAKREITDCGSILKDDGTPGPFSLGVHTTNGFVPDASSNDGQPDMAIKTLLPKLMSVILWLRVAPFWWLAGLDIAACYEHFSLCLEASRMHRYIYNKTMFEGLKCPFGSKASVRMCNFVMSILLMIIRRSAFKFMYKFLICFVDDIIMIARTKFLAIIELFWAINISESLGFEVPLKKIIYPTSARSTMISL